MKPMGATVWLAGLLLSSCSASKVREATEQTATAVQGDMVALRLAAEKYAGRVGEVYRNLDRYDLSTDKLDVEQGGTFSVFNSIYVQRDRTRCAYYATVDGKPSEEVRREVRIMTHLEAAAQEAFREGRVEPYVFVGVSSPTSVAMACPWFDYGSLAPPGLKFETFEWFQRGMRSPGKLVWSERPFTDLIQGWVMDLATGIEVKGAVRAVVILNSQLSRLARRHLGSRPERLLLVSSELSVVGASPAGKAAFPFPMLEDPDYLRQTNANTFSPEKYRLTDPSHPPGIRSVGARIAAGEQEFEETVGGRTWRFFVRPVPEVSFYIVGMAE